MVPKLGNIKLNAAVSGHVYLASLLGGKVILQQVDARGALVAISKLPVDPSITKPATHGILTTDGRLPTNRAGHSIRVH